jgi:hypothetical protein
MILPKFSNLKVGLIYSPLYNLFLLLLVRPITSYVLVAAVSVLVVSVMLLSIVLIKTLVTRVLSSPEITVSAVVVLNQSYVPLLLANQPSVIVNKDVFTLI